jgi:signal transduction histidine kinase/CheY-like chemotaxis protein
MIDRPWILDDLPVGVWVGTVPDGTVVYVNKMFERILGMASVQSSRIGDVPETYGLVDRDGNPYPVEKLPFARVLVAQAPVVVDDIVARRRNGDVHIRAFGSPIFGPERTLTHVVVAFLDISKEAEVDAERKLMQERLSFACNHAPIAIWMADAAGVITMSEGAGLASLGVKSGELVGKNLFDLYAAHPTIPGYIRRALTGDSFWYTVEVGDAVYDTWLTPVRGISGEVVGITGLSNDVSHVRKLQNKAIQNDRVMALGTLAASVAHEINNPLTYVIANGDAVADEIDALEKLMAADLRGPTLADARASLARIREGLGPIRSGASRIAGITRDLRSFSRPDESSMARIDIRTVVESVLRLVAKEVEARARLVLDLQPTPPVLGNEARLVQVVLNLIVNAFQALPPDAPSRNEVHIGTRTDGGRIVIEIADSGRGVPATDRELIFEPFFSTKEIGQGTGLGLFVCRNIVRGFSGEIEVGDRPGGGAQFRVTLPAAPEVPAVVEETPRAHPASPTGRGGHVVVIDDDAMVARALALQLREAGYRVTTFSDGQTAIEELLAARDVELVFCDLMMTGMTGIEVADRLAAAAPELAGKLVLMTGGAFSPAAREFVLRHRDRTVEKPFDIVAEAQRRLDLRA